MVISMAAVITLNANLQKTKEAKSTFFWGLVKYELILVHILNNGLKR